MSTAPPVVFVVDDDPSVRKAVERLVNSAGMDAMTYASAQEYLSSFDTERPGCLILDLSMPGVGGLELQQVLETRSTAPPIIFLTGYGDVPATVEAMKRGAVEFLTKPVDDCVLIDAIRSALAKDHADRHSRTALVEIRSRLDTLTPRELEVLRHVIAGRLNKQIAADLGTVEKTIKVHRSHLMQKLQVKSVAALVRLAGQAGIIPASLGPGQGGRYQH
jgi:FixJ family two-component response regulator